MPQMPAARLTDMHACPMSNGPVPHVGGPVLPTCSINVLTGSLPQARITDKAMCVGPPDILVKGSPVVLVNNLLAVRILVDTTSHGGFVVMGCFTVLIGDGTSGGPAFDPAAAQAQAAQLSKDAEKAQAQQKEIDEAKKKDAGG